MSRTTTEKIERVTVSLPGRMVGLVEHRMQSDGYASVSEWIRHAIREQLKREMSPSDPSPDDDPRVEKSLSQFRAGDVREIDLSKFRT